MKNSWKYILKSLPYVLCFVMLIMIISQRKELDAYQIQVNNQMESLRMSVNNDVQALQYDIERKIENANNLVGSYELRPIGVEKSSQCLKTELMVTLKEWHEDSEVEVSAEIGQETVTLALQSLEAGKYRGELLLPVEGNQAIFLSAQIAGGGVTRKEDLGSWGDSTMLLPLCYRGGGWSGPEYRDGVMKSQFSFDIGGFQNKLLTVCDTENASASVQNPEFHIYKNGELAQTIAAIPLSQATQENNLRIAAGLDPVELTECTESTEIQYSVGENWSIACETDDVIDIHFVCQDEYGLGYDFFFQSWKAEGKTSDNYGAGGATAGNYSGQTLKLFWP